MWYLKNYPHDRTLWFSDGNPIDSPRGDDGSSSRLIVDTLGFLDLTEIDLPDMPAIDANGMRLIPRFPNYTPSSSFPNEKVAPVALWLSLGPGSTFTLGVVQDNGCVLSRLECKSGNLKPLPNISAKDIQFIRDMIKQKYIPYPDDPSVPGKTDEELRALGAQLFPFTPYSFELALCVYDWTTASFARMVIPRIFQYTGVGEPPYPLDQPRIAQQIWTSHWGPCTPRDKDYMNSFMMQPADSLADVQRQLASVAPRLQQLCDTQGRVLAAGIQSLPRTSVALRPQLFSGQPDMNQLGLDHFAIEFLECGLNRGPTDRELVMDFETALAGFMCSGKSITTKVVWSFTDSLEGAAHYSNGIILIANPPDGSAVWESVTYVTPLSDNPEKIEYTFMAGTEFEIQSVSRVVVGEKPIVVIQLQPKLPLEENGQVDRPVLEGLRKQLTHEEIVGCLQKSYPPAGKEAGCIAHRKYGRRCTCMEEERHGRFRYRGFLEGWKPYLQGFFVVVAFLLLGYALGGVLVPGSKTWFLCPLL